MKKLFVTICLSLPLIIHAQDYKTLKRKADSLRKTNKYEEAESLYVEAIDLVTSYQVKVSNHQWIELCIAAQQNHTKAYSYTDDKAAAYVNWKYGENGPILKEKISELVKQKAKLVFTYEVSSGFTAETYMFEDSISHTQIGVTPAARKILFWAMPDNTFFMQAFSEMNVYEPLPVRNKVYINFIKSNYDELPTQTIAREHLKDVEGQFYTFRFYTTDNVWVRVIHDARNTIGSTLNGNTALYKLLPLVKSMVACYDIW